MLAIERDKRTVFLEHLFKNMFGNKNTKNASKNKKRTFLGR